MTQPIDVKWYPTSYLDEVMPPGRDSASAWIEMVDGKPHLAAAEPDAPHTPLADGAMIEFHRCESYDEMTLRLGESDHSFEREPPREAEQCCVLNGWQAETLSCSTDELVRQLRDADAGPGDYTAAFYTFVDAGPYRFCAETISFEPAQ